jgi:oxygen-independent coproporphyrinogen III oxidase
MVASLYIHVPFCNQKCGYCNFYVLRNQKELHSSFVETLKKQWDLQKHLLKGKKITSLYFGGGTPSLLGADLLSECLQIIAKDFSLEGTEITLEANPEELSFPFLSELKKNGFNRLSVGGQTLNDKELTSLTRRHSKDKVLDGIKDAFNAGFTNISCDIMYGIPHQTIHSFQHTLKQILQAPVTHLSLYGLTIELKTPFYRRASKLETILPLERDVAEMHTIAKKTLTAHGFQQYEISAYAKKNHQSHHNKGYWLGRPFLGLGPSACSYIDGKRFQVVSDLKEWKKQIDEGQVPLILEDTVTKEERFRELFTIHLRLLEGVEINSFVKQQGPFPKGYKENLNTLLEEGFLKNSKGRIALTDKGELFYDTVAVELI